MQSNQRDINFIAAGRQQVFLIHQNISSNLRSQAQESITESFFIPSSSIACRRRGYGRIYPSAYFLIELLDPIVAVIEHLAAALAALEAGEASAAVDHHHQHSTSHQNHCRSGQLKRTGHSRHPLSHLHHEGSWSLVLGASVTRKRISFYPP